jgi:ankyrin repeat protein
MSDLDRWSRRIRRISNGAVAALVLFACHSPLAGQSAAAAVDFQKDIQPLLETHCVGCHGPTQQMSGYRLDRRSEAFRGLVRPNIIPGSSASSRMYHRISGIEFGPQMPPTGALGAAEIERIKRWIDAGAEWPDALARELDAPTPDPAAVQLGEAMRRGPLPPRFAHLATDARVVNARGRRGSTPLMEATLYGDAVLVQRMLDAGGDPNIANDAGATPLMWALDSEQKVRLLLEYGADVNVTSRFGRTPLNVAATLLRGAPVVTLLLDYGAEPSSEALAAAALRGDVGNVRALCAAGVRDTAAGAVAALRSGCRDCFDAIVAVRPLPKIRTAFRTLLPPISAGSSDALRAAVDLGADAAVVDEKGRTTLMTAAISENLPADTLQFLIDRGADVHATNPEGDSALDFARRLGFRPAVDVLVRAGGVSRPEPPPAALTIRTNTVRSAVARSIPLLQRVAPQFYAKSGCVSCHNNTLTALMTAAARANGFVVDERLAAQEASTMAKDVEDTRDHALQQIVTPGGGPTTTGNILMALDAQRYARTAGTDAMVRLLRASQRSDGHWASAYRPPSESSEFTATAVSVRGIRLYAPADGFEYAETIARGVSWLSVSEPRTTEDRVFRLFGLMWGGAPRDAIRSARENLISTQRADGGWAQLPSLASDAYATGEALASLREDGLATTDLVYQRGVRYLLATQLEDGSWHVRKRAHPTQAFFDSGFPHGVDQYISAAATNWATIALAFAARAGSANGVPSRTRMARHRLTK